MDMAFYKGFKSNFLDITMKERILYANSSNSLGFFPK